MNCKNHKEADAKFICDKCKLPVCEECTQVLGDKRVCKGCLENAVFEQHTNPNRHVIHGFIYFILACIPGAGYMSMGLLKRGFQMMTVFTGSLTLAAYVGLEGLIPVIVIPLWFFSFFDGYSIRRRLKNGMDIEDAELLDYGFLSRHKKLFGIGLLSIGILGFLNAMQHAASIRILGISLGDIYWTMSRSAMPIMLVFVGLYLISRANRAQYEDTF